MADDKPRNLREHVTAVRYQQLSAEVRALQRQCYALATLRLNEAVAANGGSGAGLAIVTDIDETVFDNSDVMAHAAMAGEGFDNVETWKLWELHGTPRLIPGAAAFLALADRLGVAIFYVSDRFGENKAATMATLARLHLPQTTPDRVHLFGAPKTERRALIARDHKIILLLGDTLHDFHGDFANATLDEQYARTEAHADRWGQDWIVFPNAAHGTWMEADLRPWDAPKPD
ncbi:5'-nucleotidase, lipoprotein e(P4) family [Paracoccus zhejiangensis]|uniref:5'-nucleotidase n=1 Tax=Paracoccus zhejiangensis TaxID=1077935 RepID=A0A2H5F031_9RHOB|nr:HAD family acid phosphatase [Paracoccus zhejiangensis]AUH64896.1 5'-nucleotidase [Paracoccus zhejiangensis]